MTNFYNPASGGAVTKEDLLHIGEEVLAYIRELSAADFTALYPGLL